MKKIFGLALIALVFVVASCNKDKIYTKDLTGTWHAYKFLFRNVDETAQFIAAHPLYTITFTSDGKFIEKDHATVRDTVINGVTYADTTYSAYTYGTYAFANKDINLILTDTTYALIDTVLTPVLSKRTYTIFNLSGSNVQLDTDTTQIYLAKNM